jgi:hypothetical protein
MGNYGSMAKQALPITHCVCTRAPQLNHAATRGKHPGVWEVRIGAGIIVLIIFLLQRFLPMLLGPFAIMVGGLVFIVALVKVVRRHSVWCAVRDAVLVVTGYFAKSLQILLFFGG